MRRGASEEGRELVKLNKKSFVVKEHYKSTCIINRNVNFICVPYCLQQLFIAYTKYNIYHNTLITTDYYLLIILFHSSVKQNL